MKCFLYLALLLIQPASAAELLISNAWARATMPGAPMGAVYAEISNTFSAPVEITGVVTNIAGLSEVHESVEVDGMMRMREVSPFVIPQGESVSLRPGSKHIMLMRIEKPLVSGSRFTLRVSLIPGSEAESVIDVEVVVGGIGQMHMPTAP